MAQYKTIDISTVVRIDDWHALDQELAGSRVKKTMAAPQADKLFVFKEPKPQRESQIWSELIASFISGDLLGWPVQHAQIATRNGRVGNLLKYVFNPESDTFLAGEQLCKHVDPDFDPVQADPIKNGRITMCSRRIFIRSGGIVQVLFSKSISCFLAPRTSPGRVMVKI